MAFIRVISKRHYDPTKHRFTSPAFNPSEDGSGISVIDKDCILQTSHDICEHIANFYRGIAGDPPIFWEIDTRLLPESCQFVQQISSTGDDCHYNLTGLTQREARNIFKTVPLSDFRICTESGDYRSLKISDVEGDTTI